MPPFAISNAVLTHVRVPLQEHFRISSGAVSEKDALLIQLTAGDHTGLGESSPMSGSFYSSDTPESCWRELSQLLLPALLSQSFASLHAAIEWINARPESNFAKAGIETALWDLDAKIQNRPLYQLLGGENKPIPSGLAVGLYDDPAAMLRAIQQHLTAGYHRVKIKIEPGRDLALVRAVRAEFGDIPLFVDANGAYNLSHLSLFEALDEYNLMMIEQPFAGPNLEDSAQLQKRIRTPICLDESLESSDDLLRAIALQSFRIANIKIQRVGGLSRALEIYDICQRHNIPVWIGTMPELGVGCAAGIALASLPICAFPTDVEASLRWFQDDIVQPLIEVHHGNIHLPQTPGLGFAIHEDGLRRYTVASIYF
jgi:o-succinylbenzoate synthase